MLTGSVRGRMRLADEGDAQSQTELMIGAMRRMRDALFDGARPRRHSVLVTSATAGEGRTTIALNLALIAAADGWRVLLVDADAARATLSKTLDAAGNAGLFDLIEGRATLASVLLNDTDTGPRFLPLGNATRAESRNAQPAGDRREADRTGHRSRDHRRRRAARPTTPRGRSRNSPTTSCSWCAPADRSATTSRPRSRRCARTPRSCAAPCWRARPRTPDNEPASRRIRERGRGARSAAARPHADRRAVLRDRAAAVRGVVGRPVEPRRQLQRRDRRGCVEDPSGDLSGFRDARPC